MTNRDKKNARAAARFPAFFAVKGVNGLSEPPPALSVIKVRFVDDYMQDYGLFVGMEESAPIAKLASPQVEQ